MYSRWSFFYVLYQKASTIISSDSHIIYLIAFFPSQMNKNIDSLTFHWRTLNAENITFDVCSTMWIEELRDIRDICLARSYRNSNKSSINSHLLKMQWPEEEVSHFLFSLKIFDATCQFESMNTRIFLVNCKLN